MIRVESYPTAPPCVADAKEEAEASAGRARLRRFIESHHALLWRSVRRFGVPSNRTDEAVSRVIDVVMRRLGEIAPEKEQAFAIQVCVRVASEFRRAEQARVRNQVATPIEELASAAPSPEELLEQKQCRAMLDKVLNTLDPDLRVVLVLHEVEQWTTAKIAESLRIPPGTAASRLRRAREQFAEAAARARLPSTGERR